MASLPRPLSKKLSPNGNGFSPKNAYDGVFDGPPKFGAPPHTFSSRIEDYAEIFGASRASSIPILDLSTLDGGNSSSVHDRRSKLDYSKIFGGFRDEDVAASYAEMFAKENGAQSSPANTRRRLPDLTSGTLNHHTEGVLLKEASKPEGKKQFNMSYHKTGLKDYTWENETTHVAELHAVPGFTCFFDGSHPIQTREGDKLECFSKEDVKIPPEDVEIRFSNNKVSDETVKLKSKFSSKESFVAGKSSNATETNLKECSSDIFSSSSIPVDKVGYKTEPKLPMDSYFKVPDIDTSKTAPDGCSTSYSDEDLDINSAAGASAAALKRALEKAEASIKFAREMMERKKDGSQKVSRSKSKSSLDVKKSKKDKVADESSGARKNNIKDSSESSSVFLQVFSREKARKRGKVAPDFKETEFTPKMEGETNGNKLGSLKDCEGPQQIPETGNTVECITATLASEHEGSKNNSLLSVKSRAIDREDIEAAKGTLEQLGLNGKELDKEALAQKDLKRELNAVKMAESLEQHGFVVNTAEEFHSQQDYEYLTLEEDSRSKEDAKPSTGQDKYMKKIEVPLLERIEDNESKLQTRMKHNDGKCEDESQDCMEGERKSEDACEEQNDKRPVREDCKDQSTVRLICEPDDVTRATSFDGIDSENVSEVESNEQIHYDIHNVEGNQKGFANIYELEDITSKSLDEPHDEVDSCERHEGDSGLEAPEKTVVDDHAQEGEVKHRKATCIETPEVNLDDVRETTNSNVGSWHASKDQSEHQVDSGERHEGDRGLEAPDKTLVDDHAQEGEVKHRKATCIEKPEVNLDDVRETTNSNVGSWHASKDQSEHQEGCIPAGDEGHLSFEDDGNLSDATHSSYETSDCEMGLGTDEMIHVLIPGNVCTTGGLVGTAVDQIETENEMKEAGEAVVSDFELENNDFTEATFRTEETDQNDEKCEFAPNIRNGTQSTVSEFGEDEKELKESVVAYDVQNIRSCLDTAHEQRKHTQSGKETEASQPSCSFEVEEKTIHISEELKSHIAVKNEETFGPKFTYDEKKISEDAQKELKAGKEHPRRDDGANNRHREREKERMVVERAIREVRERAFAEARERAERAAVERATAEARQRVMAEAREKFEKTCAANKLCSEKATAEAKLRAERAAVERATAEARNRALEKALSQKAASGAREQIDRSTTDKFSSTSRDSGMRQNNSSSDAQKYEGESAQRRKARLERHQRTMERAAKALAEKNMRDLLAQKEQAQRNRLADILDADVRRWASGKEGNLRALLSTLQYILGPDSGWQPISLTEIIQTTAVKKAYRKATLHVHPDKLQQRGATIQQKYICEKVFDLLKAAWNRFDSEER